MAKRFKWDTSDHVEVDPRPVRRPEYLPGPDLVIIAAPYLTTGPVAPFAPGTIVERRILPKNAEAISCDGRPYDRKQYPHLHRAISVRPWWIFGPRQSVFGRRPNRVPDLTGRVTSATASALQRTPPSSKSGGLVQS